MVEASSFSSNALPWNRANIAIVAVLSIATIFALMYKGDSKRLRADHAGQGQGHGRVEGENGRSNPILGSEGGNLDIPLLQ